MHADPIGVILNATSPVTQASYTYKGKTTQSVDENGVTKLTQMDAYGRILAVCEVTSTALPNSGAPASCGMDIGGTGYLTTYDYSVANQTTVNQGGQQRVFQTDMLGRPTSVTEPESGTTTYTYASSGNGLTVTRTKPKANQTNSSVTTTATMQFDTVGRLLSITYNDGITPVKTYSYDQSAAPGGANPALPNGKGRLTSFAAGNTLGSYGYDSMGRVTLVYSCQPANCAAGNYSSQAYTYDTIGNLLSASDGAGRASSYTYTLASEPLTAANGPLTGTASTLVSGAQYGPFGQTSATLGNGLSAVNTFDPQGNLSGRWLCAGSSSPNCASGTQVYGMSATWAGGRLNAASDSVMNQQWSFGYDAMNRLASRTTTAGATQNFSYSYDRWATAPIRSLRRQVLRLRPTSIRPTITSTRSRPLVPTPMTRRAM